jgi:hypothetical protein
MPEEDPRRRGFAREGAGGGALIELAPGQVEAANLAQAKFPARSLDADSSD